MANIAEEALDCDSTGVYGHAANAGKSTPKGTKSGPQTDPIQFRFYLNPKSM